MRTVTNEPECDAARNAIERHNSDPRYRRLTAAKNMILDISEELVEDVSTTGTNQAAPLALMRPNDG